MSASSADASLLPELLLKLTRHEGLSVDEAAAAMDLVMTGRATPAQLAALLVGLSMKGERPEEIVGLARTMRAHAVTLRGDYPGAFDTCGTGGDRTGTINVSSAAALVMAACGVTVAKHGNRSVSSRCGSADVLEALGVTIAPGPAIVERCLDEVGMAFLFAPSFHPAMKHAASTRRELGLRTAFNLLGPLTNPVGPRRQIVGVPRPELTELVARALLMLGAERAWVVHGADGLDEISTTGYTKVSEAFDGTVRTFHIHPGDFGLRRESLTALAGGDAAHNADVIRRLLAGETGPVRDVVALNAGAGLFLAGRAPTIREGIGLALSALESGRAGHVLEQLIALTASARTEQRA
jgi:anthranilate phosphoribosyltransferase